MENQTWKSAPREGRSTSELSMLLAGGNLADAWVDVVHNLDQRLPRNLHQQSDLASS